MTRPTDPRGANRRGAGWGEDIGYSADAPTFTPSPRHVVQEPASTRVPLAWHIVRLETGETVNVYPLWYVIPERIEWGGMMRRVVEIIDVSPEFAPATVEELEF